MRGQIILEYQKNINNRIQHPTSIEWLGGEEEGEGNRSEEGRGEEERGIGRGRWEEERKEDGNRR